MWRECHDVVYNGAVSVMIKGKKKITILSEMSTVANALGTHEGLRSCFHFYVSSVQCPDM